MTDRKLTENQWKALDAQFIDIPAIDDSFSSSGEHYTLIGLLNGFNFYPHSREEAMSLAEELLTNGY